ncbi:LytR/AlgR family response regulator transcription factor [Bacilliculturomica massiliensis]|uniref:LytR/AlgR family response regulator transcription factor n=1 Tax=Bacilliculturomica massiliensis TaxID=1917867 RepID=UPI0010309491|nr:LytTR family transcriptional regulator DNA-binding domain-containing protein [Bacilliculturomica massiliensis]
MAEMLIRFRSDTDLESLREFVSAESRWKDNVKEIIILDGEKERSELEKKGWLILPRKSGVHPVRVHKICYLEKSGRCVLLHLMDGSKHVFYGRFEDVLPNLSSCFVRCHKSFVVNMEHTEELARYSFSLKTGAVVPVSQKRYQETKALYKSFLNSGDYF